MDTVSNLGDALQLLTENAPDPDEGAATQTERETGPLREPYVAAGATAVPAAVSSLAEAGFLDAGSIAVLLKLRDDHGDQVVRAWDPAVFQGHPLQTDGDVWVLLNLLRPLDTPRSGP